MPKRYWEIYNEYNKAEDDPMPDKFFKGTPSEVVFHAGKNVDSLKGIIILGYKGNGDAYLATSLSPADALTSLDNGMATLHKAVMGNALSK